MILGKFKENLIEYIGNLRKQEIISEKEYNDIKSIIEKEKVTIGIVGQIKSGKSTLLNALVFGRQVLPVASTPMTASLTYITYGDREEVEVEFFTADEWREILEKSKEYVKEESDEQEIVEACKDIIKKSEKITNLDSHLGKKIIISLDEIYYYVGENGSYVPITKALSIKLNNPEIRNVEFVDTPGFNDPIRSRELRSREFLKSADVVLVVLYAGRAFDSNDSNILRMVKNSGIGKVIFVLNKKDLIRDEEKIIDRVKEQIDKLKDSNISEDMKYILEDARNNIVLTSSLCALIGKLSEKEILEDENLKFYYDKYKKTFDFKSGLDFLDYSGLKELEDKIKNILKKEKYKSIHNKLVTAIQGIVESKIKDLDKEIKRLETERNSLNRELGDIKKEKENIKALQEEYYKKIRVCKSFDLIQEITGKIRETKNKVEIKLRELKLNFKPSKRIPQDISNEFSIELEKFENDVTIMFIELEKKVEELLKNYIECIDKELVELNQDRLIYTYEHYNYLVRLYIDNAKKSIHKPVISKPNIHKNLSLLNKFAAIFLKSKIEEEIRKFIDDLISEKIYTSPVDEYERSLFEIMKEIEQTIDREVFEEIKLSLKEAEKNYFDKTNMINEINTKIEKLEQTKAMFKEKLDRISNEISYIINAS